MQPVVRAIVAGTAVVAVAVGLIGATVRAPAPDSVALAPLLLATRYTGEEPLDRQIRWQAGRGGIEWGELQLRGEQEAWRTRVIVARFDPREVSLALAPAFTGERQWTIADADSAAVLAFDAGQFRASLPWGWVVAGGSELLRPQYGPLAGAVVVDSSGAVRIVNPADVDAER